MVRVLNKGRVIGAGFGDEQVLGEIGSVDALVARLLSHAHRNDAKSLPPPPFRRGLIRGGNVEGVGAGGRGRLARVVEPLHVFEAGADSCLPIALVSVALASLFSLA